MTAAAPFSALRPAPVREVVERGISEHVLRDDLPADTLLTMFAAILERAMWLTIAETMTPEAAAEAVLAIFLDGARTARHTAPPATLAGP